MTPQKIVEDYLSRRGFSVANNGQESANGIDIVAIKNKKSYLIEVKSVVVSKRSQSIKPLSKSGNASTYIAIVTPKKNVIFNTIEEHKRICSKSGLRGVKVLMDLIDEL